MKLSRKVKIVLIAFLVFIASLFDRRLEEETVWFLMKLVLYSIGISFLIFIISDIVKGIFIRKAKIKRDKEENDK